MDYRSREKVKSVYYFMDRSTPPEYSENIDVLDILCDMSVYISELEQRICDLEMQDND